MAQTTAAVSQACGKVWYSLVGGGGPWTELSGTMSSVSGTEQTRNSGEAYTFDGDTAIVQSGKRAPMNVVFNFVYTEEAAESYDILRAIFEGGCGTTVYMRWAPRGGDSGEDHISTAGGKIVNWTYPPMDASQGGPIMSAMTLLTPYVTTVTETT